MHDDTVEFPAVVVRKGQNMYRVEYTAPNGDHTGTFTVAHRVRDGGKRIMVGLIQFSSLKMPATIVRSGGSTSIQLQ